MSDANGLKATTPIQHSDWHARVVDLIGELGSGIAATRLYASSHPRALAAKDRLVTQVRALRGAEPRRTADSHASDEITIVLLEQELFVHGRSFTRSSRRNGALIRHLQRHRIERLTLAEGVGDEEIEELLCFLAGPEDTDEPELAHISLGRTVDRQSITLASGDVLDGGARGLDARQRVMVVREVLSAIENERPVPLGSLGDVILDLERQLLSAARPLDMLARLESEQTWLECHSHNVAVLTLAMCQTIKVEPEIRRELAMAAMLHDVGKIGRSPARVRQELELAGQAWELDDDHPRLGLVRLLGVPQTSSLAAVVALEHHLEPSGGGFPNLGEPRSPHPAAMMVAAAELLDMLHSVRAPMGLIALAGIGPYLDGLSGSALDPLAARAARLVLDAGGGLLADR